MDCSPPGSSVYGTLQARILEWVAILFSRGSSQLKDRTQVSRIAGGFLTSWATRKVFPIPKPGALSTVLCSQGLALLLVCMHWCRKATMSWWNQLPLCVSHLLQITGLFLMVSPWCKVQCERDLHGILQARILEWVAILFSRGSSQSRDWAQVSCIASRLFIIWGKSKLSHQIGS